MGAIKSYLNLLEQAVNRHAERVGRETARAQAQRAGLTFSGDHRIVGYHGHPWVVLLRPVRFSTEGGNMISLDVCNFLMG